MDLTMLRHRAAFMRCTSKAQPDHRLPIDDLVAIDDNLVEIGALGYYVSHGAWPNGNTVSTCALPECVVHLELEDWEEREVQQFSAAYVPKYTLAQMFRIGKARGWFQGTGGYAG